MIRLGQLVVLARMCRKESRGDVEMEVPKSGLGSGTPQLTPAGRTGWRVLYEVECARYGAVSYFPYDTQTPE